MVLFHWQFAIRIRVPRWVWVWVWVSASGADAGPTPSQAGKSTRAEPRHGKAHRKQQSSATLGIPRYSSATAQGNARPDPTMKTNSVIPPICVHGQLTTVYEPEEQSAFFFLFFRAALFLFFRFSFLFFFYNPRHPPFPPAAANLCNCHQATIDPTGPGPSDQSIELAALAVPDVAASGLIALLRCRAPRACTAPSTPGRAHPGGPVPASQKTQQKTRALCPCRGGCTRTTTSSPRMHTRCRRSSRRCGR